jgi:hypothetical protein
MTGRPNPEPETLPCCGVPADEQHAFGCSDYPYPGGQDDPQEGR